MKNYIVKNQIHGVLSKSYAALLLFVLAASGLHAEDGKWLNMAVSGKPVTFKPWEIDDALSSTVVSNNICEGLVRYGEESFVVEPSLAVGWRVEHSGRVWVFALRRGVLFQDGSLFTADDVVGSFKRNPMFEGKMERLDPFHVKCILPEKRASFIKSISQVSYAISKVLPDGRVIGTGPFAFDKWDRPDKLVLRTFEDYWGGRPSIDGVIFHCSMDPDRAFDLMRQGKIDVIDIVPPSMADRIRSEENLVLSTLEGAYVSFVYINPKRPQLDEPEFRRALNLAIQRRMIIRDVYSGQAIECRGLLPPVIGGRKEGPPRVVYAPVEAHSIIERYLKGKDRVFKMVGLPFSRQYCPEPSTMADLIAECLKDAGLEIEYVQTSSMDEYLEWLSGVDYDFVVMGWVLDTRNPDDFYTKLFCLDGVDALFYSHWESDVLESLILQARGTVSVRKRWKLYQQADDIFFEEYPWILLVHSNQLGAYRKAVTGLSFNPIGELRLGMVNKD